MQEKIVLLFICIANVESQTNFIDFVLTPLWKAVSRVLPALRVCYDNLLLARRNYQMHISRLDQGMSYCV